VLRRWELTTEVFNSVVGRPDRLTVFGPAHLVERANNGGLSFDTQDCTANDDWRVLDMLGILGRLTGRAQHAGRGVRVPLKHLLKWLEAQNYIPRSPPRKKDFKPKGIARTDEIERLTREARWMVRDLATRVKGCTQSDIQALPEGLTQRAYLLARIREVCTDCVDPSVKEFNLHSEKSNEETGNVRNLRGKIVVGAETLEVDDEEELEIQLKTYARYLIESTNYHSEGSWTLGTHPNSQFDADPEVDINESTPGGPGQIGIQYAVKNVRIDELGGESS
jgi:hypothetical protein